MATLRELAAIHKTTKLREGTDHYLDVYDRAFSPFRDKPIRLLEIGVQTGASLRMWRDYFPNGKICGLDNVDYRRHNGERIEVYIGHQADPDALGKIPGNFDVVIDDGSHMPSHQIDTFKMLRNRWTRCYCIEDLHTSYRLGRDNSAYPFLHSLIDSVNYRVSKQQRDSYLYGQKSEFDGMVSSIAFHHNLCVIESPCAISSAPSTP